MRLLFRAWVFVAVALAAFTYFVLGLNSRGVDLYGWGLFNFYVSGSLLVLAAGLGWVFRVR